MSEANIGFEDWKAEQMKDPEFQAAVEELEPAYQAARLQILNGLADERIVIAGGPKSGKTSLAIEMCSDALHTDDLIEFPWSEQSYMVSVWFDGCGSGPWVIEGVTVTRALRKWLSRNPEGKPCDRVIYLTGFRIQLSIGQERMRKSVDTVWREIEGELEYRDVILDIR